MRFMIKKAVSAFLAGVMWLTCVMPCLTGCSGQQDDKYTVAEWLDKLEDDFNLLYYTSDEPYFPNVTSSNENFDTVQIAAEWGLLDPSDGIDLNEKLTKEYAADTLVAAMAFDYEVDAGIADADKISDIHNVSIAVNEGIFTLNGGKFDPQRVLTREEADSAAAIAVEKWVGLTYAESYNKSTVNSNVINLGGLPSENAEVMPARYTVEYSGDLDVIDSDGNYVDNSTRTIHLDAGQNIGVREGSVLTMPADSQTPTAYAVVVDSIVNNSDGSTTLYTHKAELSEVFDDVDVQFSGELDLDNAVVYDLEGNRLSGGVESDNVIYSGARSEISGTQGYERAYLKTKKVKNSGSIKLGKNVNVSYSVSKKGVSFDIDTKIGNDVSVKFNKSTSFGISGKLDWKWGLPPDVREARFVLNMTDHLGGKFSYSHDFAAENGIMATSDGGVLAGEDLAKFYDAVSSAIKLLNQDVGKAAGELSAPLFKFIVPTPFGVDAEFIVRLNLSVSGEISFSIDSTANLGMEYVNKKIRPVASFSCSKELDIKAKAELRLFLGAGVGLLGFTALDAGINLGAGAKVNSKFYQVDTVTGSVVQECALPTGMFGGTSESGGGMKLKFAEDMKGCVDFIAYPIVELELCTSNCLIGKFVDGMTVTIKGEKDPFYTFHYETDNGKVDSCTRQKGDSFQIEQGSKIELNSEVLSLAVGESYSKLMVRTLPKGYSAKDLVFSMEDGGIASVKDLINQPVTWKDLMALVRSPGSVNYSETKYKKYSSDGKEQMLLTGAADGVTMLTVSTRDGLYSAQCKVIVGNGGIKEHTDTAFIISTYSLKLVPGAGGQIKVDAVPEGYTMEQVVYASSDPSVASVSSSGMVTGVSEGQAIITISTSDGKYTSTCLVFVSSAGANA